MNGCVLDLWPCLNISFLDKLVGKLTIYTYLSLGYKIHADLSIMRMLWTYTLWV